jgi:hypothetical protein
MNPSETGSEKCCHRSDFSHWLSHWFLVALAIGFFGLGVFAVFNKSRVRIEDPPAASKNASAAPVNWAEEHGKRYEFGLRADGVVVWREASAQAEVRDARMDEVFLHGLKQPEPPPDDPLPPHPPVPTPPDDGGGGESNGAARAVSSPEPLAPVKTNL